MINTLSIVSGIPTNSRTTDSLHVIKDWIMNGDEKILWLPPEYRCTAPASMRQTIVLGSYSGRVLFFEFSFGGQRTMANRELFRHDRENLFESYSGTGIVLIHQESCHVSAACANPENAFLQVLDELDDVTRVLRSSAS